jgi:hypothetical protein
MKNKEDIDIELGIDEGMNTPEKIKERVDNNLILQIIQELHGSKGYHRLQIFVTHGYLE